MDVFHWNLRLDDRDTRMLEALPRIAQRSHDRYGIRIRKMSFWRLGKDLKEFQKVYNQRSQFMNEERTGFVWLYLQK